MDKEHTFEDTLREIEALQEDRENGLIDDDYTKPKLDMDKIIARIEEEIEKNKRIMLGYRDLGLSVRSIEIENRIWQRAIEIIKESEDK